MKKKFQLILIVLFVLNLVSISCTRDDKKQNTGEPLSDSLTLNNQFENNKSITLKKLADNSKPEFDAKEIKNEDEAIVAIKAAYLQTQTKLNNGSLRKETKSYNCDGDPGSGNLLRYYEGNDLLLMVHEFSTEHYWFSKHIFLANGQPYFIYEEEGTWGFGGPINDHQSNTIDKITEQRYYLQNGKIVQHLKKSFEEKSWEAKPDRNKIANKKMKIKDGETYPLAAALPLWIAGNVSCK